MQSHTEEDFVINIDNSEIISTNNTIDIDNNTIDVDKNETENSSSFDAMNDVLIITKDDLMICGNNTKNSTCTLERIEIPVTNVTTKQFEAIQIADITEATPIIFEDDINDQKSSIAILNSTNSEIFSNEYVTHKY